MLRVRQRESLADPVRPGRGAERLAPARALRAHLDERVLLVGHETVMFGG